MKLLFINCLVLVTTSFGLGYEFYDGDSGVQVTSYFDGSIEVVGQNQGGNGNGYSSGGHFYVNGQEIPIDFVGTKFIQHPNGGTTVITVDKNRVIHLVSSGTRIEDTPEGRETARKLFESAHKAAEKARQNAEIVRQNSINLAKSLQAQQQEFQSNFEISMKNFNENLQAHLNNVFGNMRFRRSAVEGLKNQSKYSNVATDSQSSNFENSIYGIKQNLKNSNKNNSANSRKTQRKRGSRRIQRGRIPKNLQNNQRIYFDLEEIDDNGLGSNQNEKKRDRLSGRKRKIQKNRDKWNGLKQVRGNRKISNNENNQQPSHENRVFKIKPARNTGIKEKSVIWQRGPKNSRVNSKTLEDVEKSVDIDLFGKLPSREQHKMASINKSNAYSTHI